MSLTDSFINVCICVPSPFVSLFCHWKYYWQCTVPNISIVHRRNAAYGECVMLCHKLLPFCSVFFPSLCELMFWMISMKISPFHYVFSSLLLFSGSFIVAPLCCVGCKSFFSLHFLMGATYDVDLKGKRKWMHVNEWTRVFYKPL